MALLPASGRKQSEFDALAKDIHEVCNRQSGGHLAQRLISSSISNLDFSFFKKKISELLGFPPSLASLEFTNVVPGVTANTTVYLYKILDQKRRDTSYLLSVSLE